MPVAELIEKLREMPQDATVVYKSCCFGLLAVDNAKMVHDTWNHRDTSKDYERVNYDEPEDVCLVCD